MKDHPHPSILNPVEFEQMLRRRLPSILTSLVLFWVHLFGRGRQDNKIKTHNTITLKIKLKKKNFFLKEGEGFVILTLRCLNGDTLQCENFDIA